MRRIVKTLFAALFVGGAANCGAHASIVIDTSLTSLPADPGFVPVDLSSVPLGSAAPFTLGSGANQLSVSFNETPGNEGVVVGTSPGAYAAPIIDAAGDAYAGAYFSTGASGDIDIAFQTNRSALALLWGSVDASNLITFLENGTVVGTVYGTDITSNPDGNQAFGGSFYTLLNSSIAFNEIQLSSGVTSFESAAFEVDPSNYYVPEPASFWVFVAGVLGLAVVRRRHHRRHSGQEEGLLF